MINFRGEQYQPIEFRLSKVKLSSPIIRTTITKATIETLVDVICVDKQEYIFYVYLGDDKIKVNPLEYWDIIEQSNN